MAKRAQAGSTPDVESNAVAQDAAPEAPAVAPEVPAVEAQAGSTPEGDEAAPFFAGGLRMFEVEIPMCLLGKRSIPAENAGQALETYKQLGGITSTIHIPVIQEVPCPPTSKTS